MQVDVWSDTGIDTKSFMLVLCDIYVNKYTEMGEKLHP